MYKLRRRLGTLPPYDTRNRLERRYVLSTLAHPFSGYLGGEHRGGAWISRLADEWKLAFDCRHAVPCNSATSGLMAACMAVGIGPGDLVYAPVYTMSATAACAKVLGADVRFMDIEPRYFSMDLRNFPITLPKAIIVTNLFGHPADLEQMRIWCDTNNVWMIEDNAQSALATVNNRYAGTVGHLGVFSLNIHKHLQTGEGGIVVTNDGDLALRVQDACNHGELRPGMMGLNLRMTEPIAALACAQLSKAKWIIEGRRELALEMSDMVKDYPWMSPPEEAPGWRHVYYIWATKVRVDRDLYVSRLRSFGLPIRAGYSPLLSRVFATPDVFPEAERIEDKEIVTFEVCSYSPSRRQRRVMREIFKVVGDSFK